MIVAIVVAALGLKKVMEYVADAEHHDLADPLKGVALGALVGGVVVYLLAHVVFKWLVARELNPVRLAAAAVLLAAWAPLLSVPALGQLAVVAGVFAVALLVEAVVYAEHRRTIRELHAHH